MNKLASNIPNKIKQPSLCCVYCGKSYIKRVNLDKHVVICELLQKTKTKTSINPIIDSLYNDVEEPIPTQRKMFQMLIELGERYSRLEEKVDELNKWVVKKKKKINILGWLNANKKPNIVFETMIDKISVNEDDIKKLLDHSFYDIVNDIFSRTIYNVDECENVMFAFVQKQKVFYIYDNTKTNNTNNSWVELTKERLIKFLNKVHIKVIKAFSDWKMTKKSELKTNEKLAELCNKILIKIMSIDFKQDSIYIKLRNAMYSKMKTNIKELIEFDFEIDTPLHNEYTI
jgi:hypothetical protein